MSWFGDNAADTQDHFRLRHRYYSSSDHSMALQWQFLPEEIPPMCLYWESNNKYRDVRLMGGALET